MVVDGELAQDNGNGQNPGEVGGLPASNGNGLNGAGNGVNGAEVESFAPSSNGIIRGKNGQFLPGTIPPNPGGKPQGLYRKRLMQAFPPDKLAEMVAQAWATAERTGSTRGMASVLAFVGGYTMGKPKVAADDGEGRVNLRDLLAALPDEVAEPGIVDVKPDDK